MPTDGKPIMATRASPDLLTSKSDSLMPPMPVLREPSTISVLYLASRAFSRPTCAVFGVVPAGKGAGMSCSVCLICSMRPMAALAAAARRALRRVARGRVLAGSLGGGEMCDAWMWMP